MGKHNKVKAFKSNPIILIFWSKFSQATFCCNVQPFVHPFRPYQMQMGENVLRWKMDGKKSCFLLPSWEEMLQSARFAPSFCDENGRICIGRRAIRKGERPFHFPQWWCECESKSNGIFLTVWLKKEIYANML